MFMGCSVVFQSMYTEGSDHSWDGWIISITLDIYLYFVLGTFKIVSSRYFEIYT
jgi:hypothetical protein